MNPGDAMEVGDPGGDDDVLEFTVPDDAPGRRHYLVEYPGYVGSADRVLRTLGGAEGLARALAGGPPAALALRLRPGDPFSHPVYGARRAVNALVLKISRAPAAGAAGGGGGGGVRAEVVARAAASYRFSAPADYAYVPVDPRPAERQVAAGAEGPPGFAPQPLMVVPPVFARDAYFDYRFRGGGGGAAGRRRAVKPALEFGAPAEAVPPPAAAPPPGARDAAPPALQAALSALDAKPVWAPQALRDAMPPGAGAGAADDAAARLCYTFSSGPWRGGWVRRGYDPRADPAAAAWQLLEHAEPDAAGGGGGGGAGSAVGGSGPAYREVAAFRALPRGAALLQLSTLEDEAVQAVLGAPASRAPACSADSGWLTPAALAEVAGRVRARFAELAAARGPPPRECDGAGAAAAPSGEAGQPGAAALPPLLRNLQTYLESQGGGAEAGEEGADDGLGGDDDSAGSLSGEGALA